ncbi:MAG: hypothetical protein JW750_02590 [Anaerolineaceae bacterium]|nr:hypothetical protein [Anaerolineaceae bacterium]
MIRKFFLRPIQLVSLLIGVLLYALGAALASYMGVKTNWSVYIIGQGVLLMLQLGMQYLLFTLTMEPAFLDELEHYFAQRRVEHPFSARIQRPRSLFLVIAITFICIAGFFLFALFQTGEFSASVLIYLLLICVLWLVEALVPVSYVAMLVEAVILIVLVPAIGFQLQRGSMTDLLTILTFPLLMVYIAVDIVLSLEDYASELISPQKTLLNQIGYDWGIRLHHLLLLFTYLYLGLSTLLNTPWELLWPSFLSLPFAILEFIQLYLIANGGKPHWKLLRFNAWALFFFLLYLNLFTLWLS